MKTLAAALVTAALLLAGCTTSNHPQNSAAKEELLAGKPVTAIIHDLDQLPMEDKPVNLTAVVYPDHLAVAQAGREVHLRVPDGWFYVSVAPFIDQTHECFHHSLTRCLGELRNAPVEVKITDTNTGEVLIDEQTATFDNGFIGYWLPRGTAGEIEITHAGRTGRTDFATTGEAPTCITDLHLT